MHYLTRFALTLSLSTSSLATGQSIDPATTVLPWKNADAAGAQYRFADYPNVVHVLEAWTLTCGGCSDNAEAVQELAAEYADNDRVRFIDLGLDPSERDYARWIAAHRPEHPVLQDVGRRVFDALRHADSVPQGFVVNCRGQLAGWVAGAWTMTVQAELRITIAKALRTTCS